MPEEIQRADPKARRIAIMLVVVAGVAGLLFILRFQYTRHEFAHWLLSDPEQFMSRAAVILTLLAAGMSVALFTLAFLSWRLSSRIMASGRFPPPGLAVIRDTRVLNGARARRFAQVQYGLAAVIALLGVLVPFVSWRVFELLKTVTF